jgi:hypothetical protein
MVQTVCTLTGMGSGRSLSSTVIELDQPEYVSWALRILFTTDCIWYAGRDSIHVPTTRSTVPNTAWLPILNISHLPSFTSVIWIAQLILHKLLCIQNLHLETLICELFQSCSMYLVLSWQTPWLRRFSKRLLWNWQLFLYRNELNRFLKLSSERNRCKKVNQILVDTVFKCWQMSTRFITLFFIWN